jgi:MYXO-CTERM domain-containing protein
VKRLLFPALLAMMSLALFVPVALAHEGHSHGDVDCHGEGEDFHCHLEDGSVVTGEEARALAEEMEHGDHDHAHDDHTHSEGAEMETVPETGGPALLPVMAVLALGALGLFAGIVRRRS